MKILIGIFASFLPLMAFAKAQAFDPERAPFYTMSYEEVSGLQTKESSSSDRIDQKGSYFKSVLAHFNKLKAAAGHSFAPVTQVVQLDSISRDSVTWNKFSADIYYACAERAENREVCSQLEKDRVDAFDLMSADRNPRSSK